MCTRNQEPRGGENDDSKIELAQSGAEIVHEPSFMDHKVQQEDKPTDDADCDT